MQMNPGIILAGQPVNALGRLREGLAAAGQANAIGDNNRMRDVFSTQGAGILSGDPGALEALAATSPQGGQIAIGVQQNQQNMEIQRERLAITRQTAAQQAAEFAMRLGESERQRILGTLSSQAPAAVRAAQQGDLAGFNAIVDPYREVLGFGPAQDADEMLLQMAAISGMNEGFAGVMQAGGFGQGGNQPVRASEILPDGTQIVVTDSGPVVYAPSGEILQGEEAAAAVRAAREYGVQNQQEVYRGRREGTLGADIDMGGTAAQVQQLGQDAAEMARDALEQAGQIQTSLGNIDEAIDAIDRGAESGLVYNMLPRVTEAGASLQNAMDRMGLDVIGAVTFGALSEGELRLAMSTAVPRGLGPEDLRQWLVRRRSAQENAAAMLADAASFLSTPGNTINGWIEQNRAQAQGGSRAAQAGSGSGAAQEMPEQMQWSSISEGAREVLREQYSAEQLGRMYGGFSE
jgi:hypothetical protein